MSSGTTRHSIRLNHPRGRVVCPSSNIDGPGSVSIRGDRIVAVEQTEARQGDSGNARPKRLKYHSQTTEGDNA